MWCSRDFTWWTEDNDIELLHVAGVCVGILVMHGIRRRDLEDRPDIKGSLRDCLTWVDLSQDTALRRLVPSAAMNQEFFLTVQRPSAVLSTKLQGSYIPTESNFIVLSEITTNYIYENNSNFFFNL